LLTGHFFQAASGELIEDGPAEPSSSQSVAAKPDEFVLKSKSDLLKKQDLMVR
jgi:hypothetical protein